MMVKSKILTIVLVLFCSGLDESNAATNSCVFVHLDKNYLFRGEDLKGSVHTFTCAGPLAQLKVAMVDEQNQSIFSYRLKLGTGPNPFSARIPSSTPQGMYYLVVFEPNTLEVLFHRPIAVFDHAAINATDINHSSDIETKANSSGTEGFNVRLENKYDEQKLFLNLGIDTSWQFPITVSLKVSDLVQCLDEEIPRYLYANVSNHSGKGQAKPLANATFSLEGSLKDQNDQGCAYCPVVLTIPEDSAGIYYTRTDDRGAFAFTGLRHEGERSGYIWHAYDSLNPLMIFLSEPTVPPAIRHGLSFEQVEQDIKPQLLRKWLATKLMVPGASANSQQTLRPIRNYQQIALIPKYDFRVLFDEYYLEPDMRGTLRSIVPNINFIKTEQVRVFSFERRRNFPEPPLILLDGILIDQQALLELDPRSVHRVEVVHKTSSLGGIGNIARNGVISVVTKSGTDYRVFPGVERIHIPGFYQTPREDQIIPESGNKPQQVLFWAPAIIIDQNQARLTVKLPDYRVQSKVSLVGADAQGKKIFYSGYTEY